MKTYIIQIVCVRDGAPGVTNMLQFARENTYAECARHIQTMWERGEMEVCSVVDDAGAFFFIPSEIVTVRSLCIEQPLQQSGIIPGSQSMIQFPKGN